MSTAPINNGFDPFEDELLEPCSEDRQKLATKSRIGNLTVGDVRYVFTQLRACKNLDPSYTLWCGMTAGDFALSYLLMSHSMAPKKSKRSHESTKAAAGSSGSEPSSEATSSEAATSSQTAAVTTAAEDAQLETDHQSRRKRRRRR